MKRFLVFLSLWLMAGWVSAHPEDSSATPSSLQPRSEGERREYAVTLRFQEAQLSGICLMKRLGEKVVGSWLNEFGIRAFDFRYDPRKDRIELSNIREQLDRWYIRRTLRRDLSLLLTYDDQPFNGTRRGRRIEHPDAKTWILHNERHDISYRFARLTM